MNDWRNKAILVRMSIGAWSGTAGQRKCRSIAREVEESHGTQREKVKANVELLAKEDRAAAQAVVSKIRDYFVSHTVPWDDRAWRMVPASKFVEFQDTLKAYGDEFEQVIRTTILDRYEELFAKASTALNGLFERVQEFPPRDQLARKYFWKMAVEQLPKPEDLRLDCMADFQMEELRRQMEERQNAQLSAAVGRMIEQVRSLIANLVEQLTRRDESGGERRTPLHESLVGNLREVCTIMPDLNVNHDPFLANLIEKVRQELADVQVEELKYSRALRAEVREKANSILATLADYRLAAAEEEADELEVAAG